MRVTMAWKKDDAAAAAVCADGQLDALVRDEGVAAAGGDGGGVDVEFSDVSYAVTVWTPGRIFCPGKLCRPTTRRPFGERPRETDGPCGGPTICLGVF